MVILFTALTGLAYPLAVTGIAGLVFPAAAGGGLVRDAGGRIVGAALIGQAFAAPQYFHPRPSAAGTGYDASNSAGSNMGPLNPKLAERMASDAAALRKAAPGAEIPADAVAASGSGLDPEISPQFAALQTPRVAAARAMSTSAVRALVLAHTKGRLFGFMGQPRVNVLMLNLALDAASHPGPGR